MAARDVFVGIDGTTDHATKNVFFGPFDLPYSFIGMMHGYSSASSADRVHLPGPNMYGGGTTLAVQEALKFLEPKVTRPRNNGAWEPPRVIVCGYSRGAYAALRVAQALQLRNLRVDFLGLLDVVKCTDTGTEQQIGAAIADFANLPDVPAPPPQPGPRGMPPIRRSQAELNADRDRKLSNGVNKNALGGWVPNALSAGGGSFAVPGNVRAGFHARRDPDVGSRTVPMGHYPLTDAERIKERRDFACTHSAMGGMPFRGDLPRTITRKSEWTFARKVGEFIVYHGSKHKIFGRDPRHPVLDADAPPATWYAAPEIASQYEAYVRSNGPDGANRPQDRAMEARWRSSVGQRPHAGKI